VVVRVIGDIQGREMEGDNSKLLRLAKEGVESTDQQQMGSLKQLHLSIYIAVIGVTDMPCE
jgi:hypothetical protein